MNCILTFQNTFYLRIQYVGVWGMWVCSLKFFNHKVTMTHLTDVHAHIHKIYKKLLRIFENLRFPQEIKSPPSKSYFWTLIQVSAYQRQWFCYSVLKVLRKETELFGGQIVIFGSIALFFFRLFSLGKQRVFIGKFKVTLTEKGSWTW